MKHLYLQRHAKSSWKDETLRDYERPLNKRGHANLPMMAERFKERQCPLDVIMTSGARRALDTAETFAQTLGCDNLVVDDTIYEATVSELMHLVHVNFKTYDHIMIVGHNPGLTLLSNFLCDQQIDNIPTCGVSALTATALTLEKHSMRLEFFDYPKKKQLS